MDKTTEAHLRLLGIETAMAKAKASGRKRIPGDGDGDGIANEGRKAGGAIPGGPRKHIVTASQRAGLVPANKPKAKKPKGIMTASGRAGLLD